jgi:hypothetical protein
MTSQRWRRLAKGMTVVRKGSDEATTTRLIALLRITAWSAPKPNTLISNGSRNSAPPRPMRPPKIPTAAPLPKTVSEFRVFMVSRCGRRSAIISLRLII